MLDQKRINSIVVQDGKLLKNFLDEYEKLLGISKKAFKKRLECRFCINKTQIFDKTINTVVFEKEIIIDLSPKVVHWKIKKINLKGEINVYNKEVEN